MIIPNLTRCLICNDELIAYENSESNLKYCPTTHIHGADHGFLIDNTSIDIRYPGVMLVIDDHDLWIIDNYPACATEPHRVIAYGDKASEVFDINNIEQIKETIQTLSLYN